MDTRDTEACLCDASQSQSSSAEACDDASGAVQSQASSAVGPQTYYGPADAAADDADAYSGMAAAGALPAEVRTRRDESPGAPQSLVPQKQSLVLAPRAVMVAEGVTAARPERYGVKAMRIGLDIDPGYLEEIRADIARPKGKTKVELTHLNAWLGIPDIVLLVNPETWNGG